MTLQSGLWNANEGGVCGGSGNQVNMTITVGQDGAVTGFIGFDGIQGTWHPSANQLNFHRSGDCNEVSYPKGWFYQGWLHEVSDPTQSRRISTLAGKWEVLTTTNTDLPTQGAWSAQLIQDP